MTSENKEPANGAWRYDLEEDPFVCTIIEMAVAVHMWDGGTLTYVDLVRDNPHRAYVIAIEYRTVKIVDRFKSLNVIDRLMAYEGFPVRTSAGTIPRDHWIRVILDVLLARLTSIRDCCFLFAAEVYELGLDPREVSLKNLKKHIPDAEVIDLFTKIAEAARDIRDERDRHLHRGEQRALAGDMDQFFQIAAMCEPNQGPRLGIFDVEKGNQPVQLDLPQMHASIIAAIRDEYHQNADLLIQLTRALFETLALEFDKRWALKRDVATDVRPWERPNSPARD